MRWQRSANLKPLLLLCPLAAASLDEAHAAIEVWEFYSGKTLDADQKLAVELMMCETADRLWAAPTTGRAKARQCGKGDEIEVPEFWDLTRRGGFILHTAHEDPTAKSAHERMDALLDSHRDLRNLVKRVRVSNGTRSIETKLGEAHYRTRTNDTGRGLDDISRLVVDEAQHAREEQLASASNTVLANPNPQINFLGSAGIKGKSAIWWNLRLQGWRGENDGFAYLEHSAEKIEVDEDGEPVFIAPEDVTNPKVWLTAVTALKSGRITVAKLQQQLRINGPDVFARENLCIWDPPTGLLSGKAKIDPHEWRKCADLGSKIMGRIVVAVDTTYDLDRSALGVVGRNAAGRRIAEIVQHDDGSHWLEVALLDVFERNQVTAVTWDASGPAKALRPMLERIVAEHNKHLPDDRKIKLEPLTMGRYQASCAAFVADVTAATIGHRSDTRLTNLAVSVPARKVGEGWVWDRRGGDIGPLVVATCAASVAEGLPMNERRSAYEDSGLTVV